MTRPTPPQCNPEELAWWKASASSENGACVEIARAPESWVAVRDSKDLKMGLTLTTNRAWASFIKGLTTGSL
ncbi:DUF397 domain-containing protein [Streptomyces sp. NPDC057636]|uniref:DUF397 domain-containing protein n=1 Tax=Streptomyces sp. NPDC057636 TaxID=3346189 RepID=UPI0036B50B8F